MKADPLPRTDAPAAASPAATVAVGILTLALAMGVGRFAFTPLLPLMLRDGTLSAAGASEWAAANYAGYLAGALSASLWAANPWRGLRLALLGVLLTTAAAAVPLQGWPHATGPVLRFVAGVFSAWGLVCGSSGCLAVLARLGAPARSAWIFTGVGLGITVSGGWVWVGGLQSAQALWLQMTALAGAGLLAVLILLQRGRLAASTVPPTAAQAAAPVSLRRHRGLVVCYAIFGFGYIVPATYLPVMARERVADPLVFGLTWPLFGMAAVLSVVAAALWLGRLPRRQVWAASHALMGLGTLMPLLGDTLPALAASAVLVGGTFMVATMAAMQLAREREPAAATRLLARMTTAFASGQIVGPLLIRLMGTARPLGWDALAWSHAAATLLLAGSALALWQGWVGGDASGDLVASKNGD